MKTREYENAMQFGRKLFKQEQKRFNGMLKFAYVTDNDTGETLYFLPDRATADRVREYLEAEFNRMF